MRNFSLRDAACAALLFAAVAACALPSQAVAADDEEGDNTFTRASFYASAGGSYLPLEDFSESTPLGFNLRAGARFNRWVAIEAELEWFKAESGHNPYMIGGNARIYPLEGRLQPYALLGAGFLTVGSDPDGMARMGGGLEYYLTDAIGVVLETTYLHGFATSDDLVSVSWGLTYRN